MSQAVKRILAAEVLNAAEDIRYSQDTISVDLGANTAIDMSLKDRIDTASSALAEFKATEHTRHAVPAYVEWNKGLPSESAKSPEDAAADQASRQASLASDATCAAYSVTPTAFNNPLRSGSQYLGFSVDLEALAKEVGISNLPMLPR